MPERTTSSTRFAEYERGLQSYEEMVKVIEEEEKEEERRRR